jgi:transposase
LGKPVPDSPRSGRSRDTLDSTHVKANRSAAGGKSGEQNQTVGRSRGRRNTKIHALAAKGRLIAILLTGGEAHDCPVAERLIRRVKPPEHMLGDKAYDSAELRHELHERGTKPVIPNRSKQPFSFNNHLHKLRVARREFLQQVEGLQAHRNAIRQTSKKLPRPCTVDLMSLDPNSLIFAP